MLDAMMAGRGPRCRRYTVAGVAATKANRKPVESQLIALSDTLKYCADDVDTAEKVSHCER